jgi:hypothetical protein
MNASRTLDMHVQHRRVSHRAYRTLAEKDASLETDSKALIRNPVDIRSHCGTPLGSPLFLACTMATDNQGPGKSGGSRVITYFRLSDNALYLLTFMISRTEECIELLS